MAKENVKREIIKNKRNNLYAPNLMCEPTKYLLARSTDMTVNQICFEIFRISKIYSRVCKVQEYVDVCWVKFFYGLQHVFSDFFEGVRGRLATLSALSLRHIANLNHILKSEDRPRL